MKIVAVGKNQLPLFGVSSSNLKQSKKCLIGPDKHNFECYECFEAILKVRNKQITETCYVYDCLDLGLLGQPGIQKLNMITINSCIHNINQTDLFKESIMQDFKEVFHSFGK